MKSVCKVRRNPHGPARLTGNYMLWICKTPDGTVYCETRESARDVASEYNAERESLLRQGNVRQGRVAFYEGAV